MTLPELSIRRPVLATMMTMVILVFGAIGLHRLGVSLFPDVDFPTVTVRTTWENASPEQVDTELTDVLEDAIGTIEGIKHIRSQSREGLSVITIEFELFRDIDTAAQDVRDKVFGQIDEIPKEADTPVISKLDLQAVPIMWIAVEGDWPLRELTEYADRVIRPQLQKLPGVGEVRIGGGREREIRIWLKRDRLFAYQLTVQDVIAAIRRGHLEIPGGRIETESEELTVRTLGEFPTVEAFEELIIRSDQGRIVRLKDIGTVEEGVEEIRSMTRFMQRPGVGIGISPRSGANKVAVAERLRDAVDQIRQTLPMGVHIKIASDRSRFVIQSIREVRFQLLLGAIIASLVIFLFLHSPRTTLFSLIAIPTSILGTFSVMYALGFTLNNLTLLALSIAVGLVVDDAIVMIENIFRHRKEGKTAMQAALDGSREITFAVITTTLALLGIFLPVAFMQDMIGRFFTEFVVTLAVAVSISTFIALTLVPMLSSRFLKTGTMRRPLEQSFENSFLRFREKYRQILRWALNHRKRTLAIAGGAFALGAVLFLFLQKDFVRPEDQSRFMIRVETPLGFTVEQTDLEVQKIERILADSPEISHFFAATGFGGEGIGETNRGIVFVTMIPKDQRKISQHQYMAELRRRLAQLPDVRTVVSDISAMGALVRSAQLQFIIQGPDLQELDRLSTDIMRQLEEIPGIVDLDRDMELGKPEVHLKIRRDKAGLAGIDVATISATVNTLMGGIDVTDFKRGGETYNVRVRLVPEERTKPKDLGLLQVRTQSGKLSPLDNFIEWERRSGPSIVNRYDRQRSVTLYGNLEEISLGEALQHVERVTQAILPPRYTLRQTGSSEQFQETARNILFAFLLAIVLTYIVMASQFESFVHPLTLMASLPLSFIGAFGLLWITGNGIDMFSMIGLMLLVGLVTKNAILLIDYTNQRRSEGIDLKEALIAAGIVRLRPILMTSLTTISVMVPTAIGFGVGSESRQPMGIAIVGGLLSSTALTLIVIPVIYTYLDGLRHIRWIEALKKRLLAR